MIFFPDPKTFLLIGTFAIQWHTISFIAACVAGFLYISKMMQEHGYNQHVSDQIFGLALLGGIVGGRIGWVLTNLKEYSLYGWYAFYITDGGFEEVTALLMIGLLVYYYCRQHRMSFFRTMDVLSIAMMLVSMITRTGRAIAEPRLWLVILIEIIAIQFIYYVFHPYKEGEKRGDIYALTLLWIGVFQLIANVFKLDSHAANTLFLSVLAEAGGILLYIRNRKYKAPKPLIFFDFDGTIMDSEGMVINCFMHMFEKYGDPADFTHEKQLEVFGPPLEEEMAKLFPDRDPKVMVQEYRLYQNTLPEKHIVELLPNTEVVLRELKKRGYKIGIVTSRLTDSCVMWLKEFGIYDLFDVVLGRDQFIRPKPAPDGLVKACEKLGHGHDSMIYVGDNASDIRAAKNAGAFAVSYMSNKEKYKRIMAEKPNYIINELGELLPILDADHAWTYEKI